MPAEVACGAALSVRSLAAPSGMGGCQEKTLITSAIRIIAGEHVCASAPLSLMMIAKLTNFRARLKTCTADNNFPVLLLNTTPYQYNNEKLGCSTLIERVAALLMACIVPT